MRRGWLGVVLLGLPAMSLGASAADPEAWPTGEPLRVRNLSPLTFVVGLPRPLGRLLEAGATEVVLLTEHSNNFTAKVDADTAVLFDGSTTVTSLGLRSGFGERWEWGLEVPLVHHGGGFTDGFIENYHDLFGFPDGDRDERPRNELDYRVEHAGTTEVNLTDEQHALGDARVWLGYRVFDTPGRQAVLRGLLEVPSGEAQDLSGSGGTDASVWLELIDGRWLESIDTTLTLSGGVTFPGDGDLLGHSQRDVVLTAHVGLHYPVTRRLTLRAQLDGHTDVIHDRVRYAAEGALTGTLGGSVLLAPRLRLDLGVVEDLTTHHAPDVVFFLALATRL